MAAEQKVVELVIDASGVERGTDRAAVAYDHMGARADAAAARAQASFDRQFQTFSTRLPRSIDQVANAYDNLQAKLDPVFNAQLRAEREMTQSLAVINRAVLLGVTTEQQATRDIVQLKQQQIEAINRVRDAQVQADSVTRVHVPANDIAAGASRRQNLNYQLFDIGQSAYGGMGLGMIAAQQGPQILQLYAAQGGLNAAMSDFGAILGTVLRVLGPVIAAGAALYGAYRLLISYSVEATLAVDDQTRALAAQASSWSSLEGMVSDLANVQKSYTDTIGETARAHSEATMTIIANTEREFNAKKALMELEAERQRASIAAQQADLAIAGQQVKQDIAQQVFQRTDYENMGNADARVGRFAPVPYEYDAMEKTRDLLDKNPLMSKIKEMRANLELNELAAEKLEKALKKVFDPTAGGTIDAGGNWNDFVPLNPPVPTVNPRRTVAGEVDVDPVLRQGQNRVRELQLQIETMNMTAGAAAKLRYEQEQLNAAIDKHIELSPQQRSQIAKDAAAIGTMTEQLSQMRLQQDAQFELDQVFRSDRESRIASQLRGSGLDVDLGGQNAAMLRTIELLREQKKAWEDIRDVGKDAVDQIVDSATGGFENIGDVFDGIAKDILKQFTTLGVANPLKNAIFGGELPTMDTVGGIGGIFKALTGGSNPALDAASRSVGAMTVTAATVGVIGGIGGAAGTPFDALLGKGAANDNSPSALTSYAKAIQSIESSGNYGALGPVTRNGDRAYGAYQVMGNNIPSWSKEALGRVLTPEQFLSDKSAQDAIFNHRFGGYVDQYGASGAAQAWFGGPGSVGKGGAGADILGTTGNGYVEKFNKSLLSMASTTNVTTQGLGTLGNGLSQVGNALSQGGAAAPSGGGGGGLLGWLGSLFGGGGVSPTSSSWAANTTYSNYLAGVPGFADGTDSAPGGYAWIGERGKELMRVPRGAEIIPAHRTAAAIAPSAPSVSFKSTVINNSSAHVEERETTDENGGRGVEYVLSDRMATAASKRGGAFDRQLRARGATMPRTPR